MKKMAIGLNLRGTKAKRTAFRDDDHDEAPPPPGTAAAPPAPKAGAADDKIHTSVLAQSLVRSGTAASIAAKRTEAVHAAAIQEDAHVFDYDAVYEAMKGKEMAAKQASKLDKRPRYMENLMRSAAVRKIDRIKADGARYKREREAEAGEFEDKEAFVTGAYKAALDEVKRLEEEEKRREAEDAARRGQHGMAAFYRTYLDKSSADHSAAEHVEACMITPSVDNADQEPLPGPKPEDLAARGVQINASGEIVDKRQLLSAGLNVVAKPKPAPSPTRPVRSPSREGPQHHQARTSRARTPPPAVVDMLQQKATVEHDQAAQEEAMRVKLARKNTETSVFDARARYLARKKAAAAASTDDSNSNIT